MEESSYTHSCGADGESCTVWSELFHVIALNKGGGVIYIFNKILFSPRKNNRWVKFIGIISMQTKRCQTLCYSVTIKLLGACCVKLLQGFFWHCEWRGSMVESGLSRHEIVKLTTLPLFQGRGERAYDIYSRLLRERIICVMGPVSVSLDVDTDWIWILFLTTFPKVIYVVAPSPLFRSMTL